MLVYCTAIPKTRYYKKSAQGIHVGFANSDNSYDNSLHESSHGAEVEPGIRAEVRSISGAVDEAALLISF